MLEKEGLGCDVHTLSKTASITPSSSFWLKTFLAFPSRPAAHSSSSLLLSASELTSPSSFTSFTLVSLSDLWPSYFSPSSFSCLTPPPPFCRSPAFYKLLLVVRNISMIIKFIRLSRFRRKKFYGSRSKLRLSADY